MKLFHLLPLFFLTANFSGMTLPEPPKVMVSAKTAVAIHPLDRDETDKVIPWLPARRLAWDDFQCEPKKEGEAVASTSTSLGLSYQVREGKLTYHITCDFSKEKSWGSLKTDYILAHEQAHFDITELHARKLYETLNNYSFNPNTFKADIAAIYNQVVKEKEEMQHAYDGQTDHSRKKGLQVNWLDRIEQMLMETEQFAIYP